MYPEDLHIPAYMLPASLALITVATGNMCFRRDIIPFLNLFNTLTGFDHFTGNLVTHDLWRINGFLCPFIPDIYMIISPTDRAAVNFDQYLSGAGLRYLYPGKSRSKTRFFLYKCLHHFAHFFSPLLSFC